MLEFAEATGNLVFDAQIAAVCRDQGISDLVSDDRDFMRFPNIKVIGINRNPDSV
jgi:predicted nucleic acid-binding protein